MFYQHKKTGKIYYIRKECKFKHPDTRKWIDSYIYSPVEGNSIMDIRYVRDVKDFHVKFEKINICFVPDVSSDFANKENSNTGSI